ncbi:OmpP1/FadL family transporter [Shewanella marina]|uniref:OmpP1/FadL family transporter n=1 Tax=Shewanella marina TaxID=487319 RepID=UPI000AE4E80B|nr:outer membrane protein transport protein [Shewanella marina]
MKHFNKTLLALSITLASGQAMAAGFQLNAQSATGLGRAFAGDAVIADNASSMARNPATMALFDSTAISVGAILIDTDVTLKNAKYQNNIPVLGPIYSKDNLSVNDIGGMSVVPNIFVVHPLNDQWAVGMGVYSNFGTTTEYPDDFAADVFGGLTKVRSINFQGSVSYRLNEQWSFGAGLDIISGSGELKRSFKPLYPENKALDVEAEGYGLGWHVGTVFELDQNNHFGLSYRYSPTIKADGDITFRGQTNIDDTLHLPLPSLAEFSGWHQLTPKFALSYSAQYIHWSKFDVLTADGFESPIKEYNWRDTWHFSVGGTYTINDTWTARAGYMYDMGAVDEVQSIAIPDSDRQWFSAGLSYHLSKHSVIDFGMTYLMGEDVHVYEDMKIGEKTVIASITGTTRANAFLYGMQYSYKF